MVFADIRDGAMRRFLGLDDNIIHVVDVALVFTDQYERDPSRLEYGDQDLHFPRIDLIARKHVFFFIETDIAV